MKCKDFNINNCMECINGRELYCWIKISKIQFDKQLSLIKEYQYERELAERCKVSMDYFFAMLGHYYPEKLEELNKLRILI
jgi:hypothetical protein